MDFLINAITQGLTSGVNPLIYLLVLVAGIITSFTPCVYPLLPIIIGYIGARQVKSRTTAFFLSLSYVIGMAVTYSMLGIIASLTGQMFGSIQSSPWTYLIVGNVILLMAMWFMDIINIPIPTLNLPQVKGKGMIPAFFLGLVSGIIAAPCTAAVLGILLAYVATKQNVGYGGTLLFVYAIGLGTLILIAGTFTGLVNALMKSESITLKVKKVFGIALFILAQYFFVQAGRFF